jgi:hypothetical protein
MVPCSIVRHPIYRNGHAVRLLLHLMLVTAEEEAADVSDAARAAGVITRSTHEIATSLRWHRSKVVRTLAALREADAIRTRAVVGGTEVTILYYSGTHMTEKPSPKPKKEAKEPRPPKAPIDARVAKFVEACAVVLDADPDRLPEVLRKEFHAYWTEPNKGGRMRYEAQPFFDHGRRMDTWRRNAEAKGFKGARPKTPEGAWNPRA